MKIEEILLNAAFYVFAIGAVVAGATVALSKNIVRSAFALLGVLFAVAALYAFMRADFIVAAQIIIYVGGILVLIIFAVMLTHKITDVKVSNDSAPGPAAVFATLCVLFALGVVIAGWRWDRRPDPERAGGVEVSLYQGDDATGIARGGMMLGGVGFLRCAVASGPEGAAVARIEVEHAPRKRDGTKGSWTPIASSAVDLVEKGAEASLALGQPGPLSAGTCRWQVRFLKSDGSAIGQPLSGSEFSVEDGLTRPLGASLAQRYLLPFEVISVLLLAALIGAAFLARKEVKA